MLKGALGAGANHQRYLFPLYDSSPTPPRSLPLALTMRASHTHMSQPLPLPPPPLSLPSTVPRRRHLAACSSSTSSSSSSASTVSPSPSPLPSPSQSPARAASVVPFSWERHPGIPKSSLAGLMMTSSSGVSGSAPLPLAPPPLRRLSPRHRRQRRRRRAAAERADPFAAAFVECTRPEDGTQHSNLYPAAPTVSGRAGRPWWLPGGGVVGLLDLYGCKSVIAVADGALLARRPVASRR